MKILYLPQGRSYDVGEQIPLPPDAAHHCLNVLRLKNGSPVKISDGCLTIYSGTLAISLQDTRKKCLLYIDNKEKLEEIRPRLHLHLSPIPKAVAEELLRHCCELGVYAVHWTLYERSQPHWSYPKVVMRFSKILQEAVKSTGRPTIPHLNPPTAFAKTLDEATGIGFFGCTDPSGAISIQNALFPTYGEDVHLWVGPEGDFTASETQILLDRKALPISLGAYIYKIDMAALVLVIQTQMALNLKKH